MKRSDKVFLVIASVICIASFYLLWGERIVSNIKVWTGNPVNALIRVSTISNAIWEEETASLNEDTLSTGEYRILMESIAKKIKKEIGSEIRILKGTEDYKLSSKEIEKLMNTFVHPIVKDLTECSIFEFESKEEEEDFNREMIAYFSSCKTLGEFILLYTDYFGEFIQITIFKDLFK